MPLTRTWNLENLDCANCSAEIEHKISSQAGVKVARLNFMTKKLTVESTTSQDHLFWANLEKVAKSVEPSLVMEPLEAGYSKTWRLEGLDCASCASDVEKAISRMHGVSEVSLDFMQSKLTVKTTSTVSGSFWSKVIEVAKGVDGSLIFFNETKSTEAIHSPWLNKNLARLLASLALLAVGMVFKDNQTSQWFIVAAYLLSGYDVLLKAGRNILKGRVFDENFLMSIASLGAMAISQFSEGAAVMLFYQVGEYFQGAAVDSSRRSIAEAMNLKSEFARLVTEEGTLQVAPEQVEVGSVVRILNGERIPLDGIVIKGSTSIDTRSLTGESVPRFVESGDEALSGSVNLGSVIELEVTKPYRESTVSKIMALVEDATSHKAPTEQFITKFARYYTPIVVLLAALIAIVPTLLVGSFSLWLYRALVFLVISCPCALVISVPLSYFAGIGKSATYGILVKGGNYLEALSKIDTMVFDKTGTITEGNFAVVSVQLAVPCPYTEKEASRLLAILEKSSTHPIANALASFGQADDTIHASEVTEISGLGIEGVVEGHTLVAGNARLLREKGIAVADESKGLGTSVLLSIDGKLAATFFVEDMPKANAKEAIGKIKAMGIKRSVMLSGDTLAVANSIAQRVGIDETQALLLPQQKVEAFIRLEADSPHIAFVGDGINDAPVLARSKVGIAMGSMGSDAAIEAADIVIMNDDLLSIPRVMAIARKTKRIVVQNITFALSIKAITLVLGALGYATMWWAVFADVGVAILAILNALRILLENPSR